MKKALITGIAGQDGSYLSELLLEKDYEVHGIIRYESIHDESRLSNINHILDKLKLHPVSLRDQLELYELFDKYQFDECYHLASYSFVNYDFSNEQFVMNTNFSSTHCLLSVISEVTPHCRFFLAGSSEMFGNPETTPQNETSRFNPKSIYGISKVGSYYLVRNYREKKHLFACTGIMYNHESARKKKIFVTRKITSAAARIKKNKEKKVYLGNLDAMRDWGYAPDYVQAMWLMLQNENPEDFVIATGVLHTVRDFAKMTFDYLGMDFEKYVSISEKYYREAEKVPLCGDSSKIYEKLGWQSKKGLIEIVKEMVDYELNSQL